MADSDLSFCNNAAQPQCQYFVVRKKRLCRMTVRPGRQYCGEHEPEPKTDDGLNDQRVPCPNDPKHTCYVSKLEKHLTKCNARKGEDPPYIIQNINAPAAEGEGSPRIPLRDVPEEILMMVIEKVNKLYDQHLKDKISTFTPQQEHHTVVKEDLAEPGRTESSLRHLRQASRLLQLAEAEGLEEDHTCYVELGAGKGMMSYYMGVAWCAADSRVLVVDRAALRHKRDNVLQARQRRRLRADLRHVALAAAPCVRDAAAVLGLAKHLCGVATDYAIRCLTDEGIVSKTRGALIATCCHHRCEQAAYVGNKHLQALGITPEELNIIYSIVSWATCGDGRPRDLRNKADHQHTISQDFDSTESVTSPDEHNSVRDRDSTFPNEHNSVRDSMSPNEHNSVRDSMSPNEHNSVRDSMSPNEHNSVRERDRTSPLEHKSVRDRDSTESVTSSHEHNCAQDKDSNGGMTSPRDFPPEYREGVGRRAKALVDFGRVLYLTEKGFRAKLCYYVPTTESLENVCIVAKKEVLSL